MTSISIKKSMSYLSRYVDDRQLDNVELPTFYVSKNRKLFIIYRITAVLKVETDIIVRIAARATERAVILVIMYVENFKTGVIVFIGDVKMCLTSH